MLVSNYSKYIRYCLGLQGSANYSAAVEKKGVKISKLNVASLRRTKLK